jgi:hypothetical protein
VGDDGGLCSKLAMSTWVMVGWLVGWLVDWLIGWLVDWLIDWLIGWLVDWLIGWLVDWLDLVSAVAGSTGQPVQVQQSSNADEPNECSDEELGTR